MDLRLGGADHWLNARLGTWTSLWLVATGLALGILWSKAEQNVFWMGGPREVATLCAVLWLGGVVIAQESRRTSEVTMMRLRIAGNIVISLAWFGAGILSADPTLRRCENYWPLAVFWGVHLLVLALGTTSAPVAMAE